MRLEARVMKVSLHHNMNYSDWSKVLLHSKYRANVLISRMHAARSNSNSNSTFIHQLSIVSGNSDGTCYIVNVDFGTPPKQNIKMKFDTAADVSWLQCNYNAGSSTHKRRDCESCYRQVDGVACNGQNLEALYAEGNKIMAYMSQERLWLDSQSFENFGIGCGFDFKGFEGINPSIEVWDFGRNSISMSSQSKRTIFSFRIS